MTSLPVDRGVELLSGAVDYLLGRPEVTSATVGSVGFCMGGGFVLYQAAQDPRVTAAVPFYGVIQGKLPDFSGMKADVLGHFGETDTAIPPASLPALSNAIRQQAGVEAELRVYPAGHAFFNDQRPDAHHAESATRAWQSTLKFLHAHLS
jgi:carboxymethylenebutenolidase